jgi:hypothetical protein
VPIIDLQQRFLELGRIRTGIQVDFEKDGKAKSRPEKLDTFRLTSPNRALLEAAIEAYGQAEIRPWGNQWEVITPAKSFDILVPPGQTLSQWNELWTAAGCLRRCDGVTNAIDNTPCACPKDPAARREAASARIPTACKPVTRLSVILTALPGIGVWRLDSHGYYAAVELAGAARILSRATAAGYIIPARLRLEQREKRIPGRPTNHYAVPVIDLVETRIADLLPEAAMRRPELLTGSGPALLGAGRPALPSTPPPASSDLRAPAVLVDDDLVDESILADPGEPPSLLELLREGAAASSMTGPRTDIQHEALTEIFAPLKGVVGFGLDLVFGPGTRDNVPAAAAQSIADRARRMGAEAFTSAWRAMVAEAERGEA